MRRYASRHSLQSLSELNVTPLIDLAFVLLIIFMITTPLIESSMDLIVPTSVAARDAVSPADVQVLEINRDGVISLNNEEVALGELTARLTAIRERNPDAAVVIRPHRDLTIQVFVSLMDAVRQAGITRTGIITRADEGPGGGR